MITRKNSLVRLVALAALLAGCGRQGGAPAHMYAARAVAPSGMAAPSEPAAAEAEAKAAEFNTEAYDRIVENHFLAVTEQPLSTFSVDVDTAAYSNVRRFVDAGERPPPDAVRIEELVNYFHYDYPNPTRDVPFSVSTEVGACPWNGGHRLVHIGVQGKRMANTELPPKNLVFLVDVSGSMSDENKLPLLKQSLADMLDHLGGRDRVAIVVYAGASGLALPPTSASNRERILGALDDLEAGGSTNGGEGIELAYRTAESAFIRDGINRVLLATDGDFNVGVSSRGALSRLIEQKRKTGVFLTVLGFGTGNYKDAALEQLSNEGNGNFAYIDGPREARKVLVDEMAATLVTIAKDVKIQVEFNPVLVGSYRLIGYENRRLENRDFDDDTKDAGEIGAGHSVTALYEITSPRDATRSTDALKYQTSRQLAQGAHAGELLTVKVRYKRPGGNESRLVTSVATDSAAPPSADFRFAASVAAFGLVLRDSQYKGTASFEMVQSLGRDALGADTDGLRSDFLGLSTRAARLSDGPLRPL